MLLDVRQGAQRPSFSLVPPGRVGSEGGWASELAADAGLILDDWQSWVLDHALASRADGRWAAFEVCLIVARQNGKGTILEALELYHLFVLGTRLITHSAHEFATAHEHFLRIQDLIVGSDDLHAKVEYIHVGNNDKTIKLKSGARLKFVARKGKGSMRGFSGDLVVLDEAYDLPDRLLGSMMPAVTARPNPQIWYASSAPHSDSHVLHRIRNRAVAGDEDRLFLAEWGNERGTPDSEEARARANPGYPHRLSPENLDAERATLAGIGEEYERERLGIPSIEDGSAGVFPPGMWAACGDTKSEIVGPVTLALEVAPGLTFSTFAAAGTNHAGLAHVETAMRAPGTGWIVDQAVQFASPIVVAKGSPAEAFVDDLKAAGVTVVEMAQAEFPSACGMLQDRVLNGTVRHPFQGPLEQSVAGGAIKLVGDTWRWSRTAASFDPSPLCAVTVALWAANQPAAPQVEVLVL